MFRPQRFAALHLITRVTAAFLLGLGLMIPAMVSAQDEQVKLAIVPVGTTGGYFDLTLEPGDTRELSVQLSNRGTAPVTARTYPADAYTSVNGGFAARLANEPISGTTRWINYKDETLDLEPGETITRTFTLSVPEDGQPGQYLTSLVIQNAEPIGDKTGGVGFNQVIRQTIAVAIRIPGPDAPALQIGEASHEMVAGKSVISIEIMNTGNVHLVPQGEFTLTNVDGTVVAQMPLQMATVYAGTSTMIEAPLPMLLDAGAYTANLVLQDDTYGVRAESRPLPLSIPVLDVPQQVEFSEDVTDPAAEPVANPGVVSIPVWILLLAISIALVLGGLIVLAVVLRLLRSAPQHDRIPPNIATADITPARKSAVIRPLIPPSRSADLKGTSTISRDDQR